METTLKFVNGKKTRLATELHPDVKEDIRGMFAMTEAERAYRWLGRLISVEWVRLAWSLSVLWTQRSD
jgi:hypothetical protein